MQPSLTLPFLLSIKSSLELLKTALIKQLKNLVAPFQLKLLAQNKISN
jgi:hypothetical protein